MKKLILVLLFITQLYATNYYVSNTGNDSNNGLSTSTSWATIIKVNEFTLSAGDSVFFKCGDTWRMQQFIPQSGNSTSNIIYSKYGTGENPTFMMSLNMNDSDDWELVSGNIWKIKEPANESANLVSTSAYTPTEGRITLYYNESDGAEMTINTDYSDYHSSPAATRIDVVNSGSNQTSTQYMMDDLSIENGKFYKLSFWAKSSLSIQIGLIRLMKDVPDYGNYCTIRSQHPLNLQNSWTEYTYYYLSNTTTNEARITLFLGNTTSSTTSIFFDDIGFYECEEVPYIVDVGNIVMDYSTALCGVKKWSQGTLMENGDFWYDKSNGLLLFYCTTNPALSYNQLEVITTQTIINQSDKSYITYLNLNIKNGGSHGIGGGNTQDILIDECTFSFIGGGDIVFPNTTTQSRFGNAIEFWEDAKDNTVQNCTIYEIYDAGVTNQSTGVSVQENIIYRNNVIYNCEYSFEYFQNNSSSTTTDIQFINNTCSYAGYGWGHSQRMNQHSGVDSSGRHICIWSNQSEVENFNIKNNVFYEAKESCLYMLSPWNDSVNLTLDSNFYYQTPIKPFRYLNTEYTTLALYQTSSSKDANSVWFGTGLTIKNQSGSVDDTLTIPILVNYLNTDFNVKVYSFKIEHDSKINIIDYDTDGSIQDGTTGRLTFKWITGTSTWVGSYGINKLITSSQDTLMSIKAVLLESGTCNLNLTTKFNNSALSISNNAGTITIEE